MTEIEKLMYRIMGSIYETDAPIIFKGALITKLILSENGYSELSRETKDIDANWVGEPPTMEVLVEAINKSLKPLEYALEAIAYRTYSDRQSAGIKIVETITGDEITRMDIDIKPVKESHTYWYGNMSFKGTTVNQIMCDKISSLSSDKIFRRIKDMVDIYALSHCVAIDLEDILNTGKSTGREISDFNTFLSKPKEIEHAYGKLRGIEGKPLFKDIYLSVKRFIIPFSQETEKNMVWNNQTHLWKEKGKPSILKALKEMETTSEKSKEPKNNDVKKDTQQR